MKRVLLIIANKGFQDFEYLKTRKQIESAGIEVSVASTSKGICKGSFGLQVKANLSLEEVNISDFDAVVFIGGEGTPSVRKSPYATRIASEAYKTGKVIGAICWAPTILAKASILKGKRATVWVGFDDEMKMTTSEYLEQMGSHFIPESVIVDGKIVTANGPASAEAFGKKVVELLK